MPFLQDADVSDAYSKALADIQELKLICSVNQCNHRRRVDASAVAEIEPPHSLGKVTSSRCQRRERTVAQPRSPQTEIRKKRRLHDDLHEVKRLQARCTTVATVCYSWCVGGSACAECLQCREPSVAGGNDVCERVVADADPCGAVNRERLERYQFPGEIKEPQPVQMTKIELRERGSCLRRWTKVEQLVGLACALPTHACNAP